MSLHVSAYSEVLQSGHEKPAVKQHLAAIRMLLDWLVTGQVVACDYQLCHTDVLMVEITEPAD